jgi:hypothetical protein
MTSCPLSGHFGSTKTGLVGRLKHAILQQLVFKKGKKEARR